MKTEIGAYEAKTKLPELLRQVREGKRFTITSRGEPVADLVPSSRARGIDRAAAVRRLKAFMAADPVRGVDVRALAQEGRD